MNYEKNYYDYINYVKTLNREREGIYYELHHIIPKSMGGNDSENNLVLLTLREHYLAHYLLWKIYNNKETLFAFFMMNSIYKTVDFKLNSKLYSKLKNSFIKYISKKVICLETGEIFESLTEACKKNNLRDGYSISISIKNKKRIAAGYHWDYYDENTDYTKNKFYGKEKSKFAIIRLEDAKIYYGYKEASFSNKISIGSLSTVITKENLTAAGYHWDYYDKNVDYTKNKFYGKNYSGNKIKVICLESNKIFNSQTEAAIYFNIKVSGDIKRACLNKKFTTAGYHWDYYDENTDYTKNKFYGRKRKQGKKVICLETGEIFEKLKDAAKKMNLNSGSLTAHLKGEQKTFGRLHWKEFYEN